MVANETSEAQLARAKGYPYARPDTSFLFVAGDTFLFDNTAWQGLDKLDGIVGRCGSTAAAFGAARGVDLAPLSRQQLYWPVLAIGSNAGPEQLRRKYPREDFPDVVIPVVQVELHDFDVVYTPYIASYGSCTATLEHSPGTVASIFITYLTEPLMQRMHATEGGYNLCRLSGLTLAVAPRPAGGAAATTVNGAGRASDTPAANETAGGVPHASSDGACSSCPAACYEVLDWVYQYNHKLGCLDLPVTDAAAPATPVAIAEIPARGRAFPAATQVQILAAIREAAAAGQRRKAPLQPVPLADILAGAAGSAGSPELDEWILTNINESGVRVALGKRLAQHARPFTYPDSTVIEAL